ncbi:hypothetical protein FRC08_018327 [Ceratobasidium sp. 394]|nr:hypothetical protein FRC08_018327 [Ceratobasidium sp. 394]KAG9089050.1 hypothetical protein FS749_001659 [Ceratobasidium sp. UAMH 11750]
MATPDSSTSPIPFDIIITILRFAFATPTSVPPSAVDHQLRISALTLSHEIRDTFKKYIYHTVVLWSMGSIRMFADTLDTSPHLGPLIHNLWAGNDEVKLLQEFEETEVVKNGCEDVADCLKRILAMAPNLQRLYVAINVWGYWHKFECPVPESVQHLVLPGNWLHRTTPRVTEHSKIYEIPPDLGSLRIRGRVRGRDMIPLRFVSSRPLRVIVEVYHPDGDSLELGVFLGEILDPFHSDPWKSSIEIVSLPAMFERLQEAIAWYGSTYGSLTDMSRARVVSQPLDDVGQLEQWLLEGKPSPLGPF